MNAEARLFLFCLFLAMALAISAGKLYVCWQTNRWRKGAPPYVGWWLTQEDHGSESYPPGQWRWFDGENWSWSVLETADALFAEKSVAVCSSSSYHLHGFGNPGFFFWNYTWPKNARVPRVDPETAELVV